MLGTCRVVRNERQVDVRLGKRGKLDFRLFRGFFQTLHREFVIGKIDSFLVLELGNHVVHDALIEIVAAQKIVSVGRQNFKYAVADFHNGDVERAAAEIVNDDLLIFALFVKPVTERGRSRFVDDAKHVEPGDFAGVLRRLSLTVCKISRAGNNGVRHLFSQICFRILFQLGQNHS